MDHDFKNCRVSSSDAARSLALSGPGYAAHKAMDRATPLLVIVGAPGAPGLRGASAVSSYRFLRVGEGAWCRWCVFIEMCVCQRIFRLFFAPASLRHV